MPWWLVSSTTLSDGALLSAVAQDAADRAVQGTARTYDDHGTSDGQGCPRIGNASHARPIGPVRFGRHGESCAHVCAARCCQDWHKYAD